MQTRRTFSSVTALLGAAMAALPRTVLAQANGGQDGSNSDGLSDRGAPTGRTGAATRGAAGDATLDLAAPLRGIGLTSSDRPTLYYFLSGGGISQAWMNISTRDQARPLATIRLPQPGAAGSGHVRLPARLSPNRLYVWSVTAQVAGRGAGDRLVATALIEYQPGGVPAVAAMRGAAPQERITVLDRAGYWYDAFDIAMQSRNGDYGRALNTLLAEQRLRMPAGM